MARVYKNKLMSGVVGNLIFRNLDGVQVVQSKASSIKQSKLTKLSSHEFRDCSLWAKLVRLYLADFLIKQTDSYMYRRLTGSLYQALLSNTGLQKGERTPLNSNLDELVGFDFNSHSPFKDYFFPALSVTLNEQRQVELVLPEFEPKTEMVFPEKAAKAELVVYAIATNLMPNATLDDAYMLLPIDNNHTIVPQTTWTSPVLPESQFVLVVAKIMYYNSDKFTVKNYLNTKQLNPAVVVLATHT